MFSSPKWRMKCLTDSAMEFTWPGVPVTACASMRPVRSKMPADKSPASRTIEEKAVRSSVCACSSTTAIRRFHMICSSMSPIGLDIGGSSTRSRLGGQHQGADRIDGYVEGGGGIGRRALLDEKGGTAERNPGREFGALVHRHLDAS